MAPPLYAPVDRCYYIHTVPKHEILLADREFLFPSVFHYYAEPLVVERAKDQYLWDSDGKQYLDFFGGILTISVGHCNEYVNGRVKQQMDRYGHVSTVYATEPMAMLAKRLAHLSPEGALTRTMFTNSGTEANETAIVAARCYTGSTDIIALRHAYHGRSNLAMAVTGHAPWRAVGAPQPGIVFAHNAYCYRCPFGLKNPECGFRCATDVEELIRTTTPGRVAGFIAEPIQGVGGFITPPKEYFGIVAEIVRKYGGIIISDEVQTAWGRTGGKWWGMEQYGVKPDVITSAKGLANGMPVGITMARDEIAKAVPPPTISTFGGNPITAAAAQAVLDFIEKKNLLENAADAGAHLRAGLNGLAEKHQIIGEVRGMGLMLGIELVKDRTSKEPAAQETNRILEASRREGILIGKGGLYNNTLRVTPPLNISKTDIDEFLVRLDRAFTSY
ncbi:MAG: aspartate aminotransferase family protein [Bryobacterales bacterium]|nr:aspartate aminotransferase family protein [Bryobacterales bacterium]